MGKWDELWVGGMLAGGVIEAAQVTIVETSEDSQAWWAENHSDVQTVADLASAVAKATLVLMAVKPNVVPVVLGQDKTIWAGKLVVSHSGWRWPKTHRCGNGASSEHPCHANTPSLVGEGASGFCGDKDVTEEDFAMIQTMLESVGVAVRVSEYQMDAVTGLSGSGPAYVC